MDVDAAFEEATQDEPALHYANVGEFVSDYLADVMRRRFGENGRRGSVAWCAQWWRHPEAVSRLDALWLAWEQMRTEGGAAMAGWWRDYADPTMRALFQENGTFEGCTPEAHDPKGRPLPLVEPPDGLFD